MYSKQFMQGPERIGFGEKQPDGLGHVLVASFIFAAAAFVHENRHVLEPEGRSGAQVEAFCYEQAAIFGEPEIRCRNSSAARRGETHEFVLREVWELLTAGFDDQVCMDHSLAPGRCGVFVVIGDQDLRLHAGNSRLR